MNELIQKYPDIETALENYQQVVESLDDIENEVMNYASSTIINTTNSSYTNSFSSYYSSFINFSSSKHKYVNRRQWNNKKSI